MIKEIYKTIKLLRYSDSLLMTILLSITSFLLGLYLLLVTDNATYGCLFITLAPMILAYTSASLTTAESIAASPKRRDLVVTIPCIFTFIAMLTAYICLCLDILSKHSSQYTYYSYDVDLYVSFYYQGVITILISAICLSIAHIYTYVVFIHIIAVIAIDNLLDILIFLIFGTKIDNVVTLHLLHLVGIIILIGGFLAIIKLREYLDEKPFSNLLTKIRRKRTLVKWRVPLAIVFSMAIVVISIGFYIAINSKKPDGWYDKSYIKEQYSELLKECNQQLEFEDYDVVLQKQYYNAKTGDGCFVITIVDKKNTGGHYSYTNNSYKYTNENGSSLSMVVDCNGTVNIEETTEYYLPIGTFETTFYVYVTNMPTDTKKPLSIYFISENDTDTDSNNASSVRKNLVIENNSVTATFDSDNIQMDVSFASLLIHKPMDISELSINMKDGSKINIVDDDEIAKGFEKYQTKDGTKYSFDNLVDVDNIKDITCKGVASTTDYTKYAIYSSSETYNMKQTIYGNPVDGQDNLINCTIDIQWTDMPKYRKTDFINIDIEGAKLHSTNDITVTQKVLETLNGHVSSSSHLQSQYTKGDAVSFIYLDIVERYYIYMDSITPSTYYANDNFISSSIALHSDTSARKYTDESITFDLLLELNTDDNTVPIVSCTYLHQKLNFLGEYGYQSEISNEDCGIVGCKFNQTLSIE